MDTHDKILEAAHQLVDELGRQALSFRKVAARAGVSVGTVQYYFSSMDQLLDALTDPWHDGLTRILKSTVEALPTAGDREGLLLDMCGELYRLAVEHRQLLLTRRLDTLERGELMSRRQQPARRWIRDGSAMAAAMVGGDPLRWQLTMMAIEHLIVGFALSERHRDAGVGEGDLEAFLRDAIRGLGREALGLQR